MTNNIKCPNPNCWHYVVDQDTGKVICTSSECKSIYRNDKWEKQNKYIQRTPKSHEEINKIQKMAAQLLDEYFVSYSRRTGNIMSNFHCGKCSVIEPHLKLLKELSNYTKVRLCPFCKEKAEYSISKNSKDEYFPEMHCIQCSNPDCPCEDCRVFGFTFDEVLKNWNGI